MYTAPGAFAVVEVSRREGSVAVALAAACLLAEGEGDAEGEEEIVSGAVGNGRAALPSVGVG